MDRFYCEHCGEKVSKTLYYQHKKLYYTAEKQHWEQEVALSHASASEEEDFTFSDEEEKIDEDPIMEVDNCIAVSDETVDSSDDNTDFDFDKVS